MKIKPSIKVSILVTMLLLGAGISAMYSAMMFHYFVKGLHIATYETMKQVADVKVTPLKQPVAGNFYISDTWEAVPEHIRINYASPPVLEDRLQVRAKKEFFHPPEVVFFVMKDVNQYGDIRFVSRSIYADDLEKKGMDGHFRSLIIIIVIFVSTITFIYFFTLLIFNRISKPVERLGNWAETLNEKSLNEKPPVFEYKELNQLASLIHSSLNSVKEVLNREHDFLRYASHELRTPIAVLRTNVELLTKINKVQGASDKQVAVLERIERAGMNMGHLTEVLLWLGREENAQLEEHEVELDRLLGEVANEHKYLLNGKPVNVLIKLDKYQQKLPITVCRIILSNLIRNAYQHTQTGIVDIRQEGNKVVIENISDDDKPNTNQGDLGFGLGLQLTEKLIQKFGWHSSYQTTMNGKNHISIVTFS